MVVNLPMRNRTLSLVSALCLAACTSGNYAPVVYHQFGATGDVFAQDDASRGAGTSLPSSGDPSMRTAGLAPVQSEPLGITGATLPPPSGTTSDQPIEAEQPHSIVPPLPQSADTGPTVTPAPVPQPQPTPVQPQATAEASPPAPPAGQQAIVVKPGETLFSVGRNYHVSRQAVIEANKLQPPYALKIGSRLIIPSADAQPSVTASAQPAPAPAPPAEQTASSAPVSASSSIVSETSSPQASAPAGKVHVVMPGETVASIARKEHVQFSQVIKLNGLSAPNQIKVGQKLKLDDGAPIETAHKDAGEKTETKAAEVKPTHAPAPSAEGGPLLHIGEAPVPPASARPAPEQQASLVSPSKQSFIWPVSGRILSAFGPKDAGRRNDGVNIAAPIGTAVRATRAGEVIYVGNELPGYGNLVLIRHDDGYVSAYAHNSRVLVKRGAFVQQGQEIAESGETGSVSVPQVHFEIRKDRKPVDPLDILPKA